MDGRNSNFVYCFQLVLVVVQWEEVNRMSTIFYQRLERMF